MSQIIQTQKEKECVDNFVYSVPKLKNNNHLFLKAMAINHSPFLTIFSIFAKRDTSLIKNHRFFLKLHI